MNKKWVLCGCIALLGNGYANDECVEKNIIEESRPSEISANSMIELMSASPMSANNWYLFVDALYWHASVGNYDWAVKMGINDLDVNQTYSKDYKKDFKFSWGFRVGLGMNTGYNEWYSELYYTRFYTANSLVLGTNNNSQNTATLHNAAVQPNFFRGESKYKITFNMLDWELGRSYFISPSLAISPYIGVKGGWISQTANEKFNYLTNVLDIITFREANDFWGVGPLVGMKNCWDLGQWNEHHFALFGNCSGALMYGHFDEVYHVAAFVNGFPPTGFFSTIQVHGLNHNLVLPMLRSVLGLEWHTGFNQNKAHFGLQVGYELQYWFRQNQFIGVLLNPPDPANSSVIRLSDDLALQGLTVDFRIDF